MNLLMRHLLRIEWHIEGANTNFACVNAVMKNTGQAKWDRSVTARKKLLKRA